MFIPKALFLFSGGLDSILGVKILQRQGIEVVGVNFTSYFFDSNLAQKSASKINLSLKIVDFSQKHLEIVKNPKFGRGKGMNPCIDCHLLMFIYAKKIMESEKFNFVASGEVLGERPMSQTKKVLELIEKGSSLEGYLLRPLSAKLLPPTIPEQKGWVVREKLLDIQGRSRKKQIQLAKEFGITDFPNPAGGCILADIEFSKRLKELFLKVPDCQGKDVLLLKIGRHFWEGEVKIVIGRQENENQELKKLASKGDLVVEMRNYPGPTALIRNYQKGDLGEDIFQKAKELIVFYSKRAKKQKDIEFEVLSF